MPVARVEHRHVVVGVRCRAGLQMQHAAAEIEVERIGDGLRRHHDVRAGEIVVAHPALVARQIALGAGRQAARHFVMRDEFRFARLRNAAFPNT